MRTTYGQKGGEGPTRGKRATTYTATAPDGTTLRTRAMFIPGTAPTTDAVMLAYEHRGTWYPNGVWAAGSLPDWARGRTALPATPV